MRKIKKINGYLVVRFNDRERREFEQLGAYGVIDAERYTGTLEVDRDVMEYDDAETLEAAMEQARGLESELDVEEPEVKVTIVKETDQASTEEEVDPQRLLAGWETDLARQIESGHYPGVTPTTARHELYGFKVALKELGLLDAEACYVLPGVFGSEGLRAVKEYREGMKEGPPDKQAALSLKGSLPDPSEPETGSFCKRAAALLERFIDMAGDEVRNAPNDQAAKEREKLLIYLAKLNQREAEAAGARHRGELAELARLMETGYLEFWIKDTGAEDVTVEVFDGVLFRCRAELTFRKIPFQPHYVLGRYRPL